MPKFNMMIASMPMEYTIRVIMTKFNMTSTLVSMPMRVHMFMILTVLRLLTYT